MWRDSLQMYCPHSVLSESGGPCGGPPACFVVASDAVLSEGHRHDGPGVCMGDAQTKAYLRDMGMTGLASAWVMARRRPI